MAYIDKMHFNKEDIPKFYEYLKSIDEDFKKFFPNSSSILNYTYYNGQNTPEKLKDWTDDIELPVSNFPEIVDRWLAHREDLPEMIREQLEFQYGVYEGEISTIFTEPIYNVCKEELSHKFKIVKWTRCEGKRFKTPMTGWWCDVVKSSSNDYWRYYYDLGKFVRDYYVTPEYLGYSYCYGGTSGKFKSIKAIFRYLRKHGFPKGTVIRIRDWRYKISELEVLFV